MEKEIKEELFIPKTKHKGLKIILAIILIGALAYGGYYLYKEKFCNPNITVSNIIEDSEKQIKNDLNDNNLYKINGILKIDGKLNEEYKPVMDILKNLDLNFILESDAKNNLFNISLNTKYKKEQLPDINIYNENDSLYILLQDVFDKYIEISSDEISRDVEIKEKDISKSDIETMINSIIKAIKSSIKSLDYKRTEATIKIDENDRNVYNNYVQLNETEMKKLLKDIVNTLANDSEFIKVFKKIAGEKAEFTDLNKEIDNAKIPGTYQLNFYTDKNIFSQKLVSVRLENTNDGVTSSIYYDKVSNDEVIISVNTSGGTITSRIKKTNSVFNANLNINILGYSFKLDLSSNYEKIKEITKPDISNSKKIEDLTEEEDNAIDEKLQQYKGMLSLIKDSAVLYPAP